MSASFNQGTLHSSGYRTDVCVVDEVRQRVRWRGRVRLCGRGRGRGRLGGVLLAHGSLRGVLEGARQRVVELQL